MANAGAKLSSFPEVNDIQTGDMFPLLSGGNTNAKIDYSTLAKAITAKLESEKADKTTATSSADGLMSKADKAKLDGIGTGSNVKSVNGKTGAVTLAKSDVGLSSVANLDQSKAIKSIARSGTTFTATALDGTTTTFSRQEEKSVTAGIVTVEDADGGDAGLTLNLEPHQDLNGYNHPWVGGAGKNLIPLNLPITLNGVTFSYDASGNVIVNGTSTAAGGYTVLPDITLPKGTYTLSTETLLPSGAYMSLNNHPDKMLTHDRKEITFTLSAATALMYFIYLNSGVSFSNVKLNPQVESGSTATPYEPYSNICPINGHNDVSVTRAGKNVFPSKRLTQTLNGITIHSNDDGSFTVNGTATATVQFNLTLNDELKLQSGQYTVDLLADKAVTFDGRHVWWFFYNTAAHADIVNCGAPSKTFSLNTVTATRFYLRIISGATVDNVTLYPMLVYGSDAPTEFEPYNGNTYNISLSSAGTVYGGSLDVTSGKLTVDRVGVTISDLAWTYDSSNTRFTTSSITNVIQKPSADNVLLAGLMSSAYTARAATQLAANDGSIGVLSNGQLLIKDTNYTVASNFVSAMGAQSIVYPLATPRTYQLTPTEVTMLIGHNTIWMDADGKIKLDYKTNAIATKGDVNEAIARIKALAKITEAIAPVESSYTATQNYSVGDYLIVDYKLYKVTAAIANSGTIAVGTNVTATTIMTEIKALA